MNDLFILLPQRPFTPKTLTQSFRTNYKNPILNVPISVLPVTTSFSSVTTSGLSVTTVILPVTTPVLIATPPFLTFTIHVLIVTSPVLAVPTPQPAVTTAILTQNYYNCRSDFSARWHVQPDRRDHVPGGRWEHHRQPAGLRGGSGHAHDDFRQRQHPEHRAICRGRSEGLYWTIPQGGARWGSRSHLQLWNVTKDNELINI